MGGICGWPRGDRVSVVAVPWLTSLAVDYPFWRGLALAMGAGAIVSVVGFVGDVNMWASSAKQELKIVATSYPEWVG